MARILIIHRDPLALQYMGSLAKVRHEVLTAPGASAGIRQLGQPRPEVIVVGHDQRKDGLQLLEYLKVHVLHIPVVVILSPRVGSDQPALMKLGARIFLEYPVDGDRLERAIQEALQAQREAEAGPPPVTEEELRGNLSMLERRLNAAMKCQSGKNQVYIRSRILGVSTTRPRITLSCPLRPQYGLTREIYYEHIRDVCCGNPAKCEALQRFQEERRRGVAGL